MIHILLTVLLLPLAADGIPTYPIVDTAQIRCYDDHMEIAYPQAGMPYFGQDAQYRGLEPTYQDNGDDTISDINTGLMWQQDPGPKVTYQQALDGAAACRTGGYSDWRLPTIKELYSLILFTGLDPDPQGSDAPHLQPFIDNHVFHFRYGNPERGERIIDIQYISATRYTSTTMHANATAFGVNFADGRIKGYPIGDPPPGSQHTHTYFALYVRGNPDYGHNRFHDNGDGTITDQATGLTWMQVDSGHLHAGSNHDGKLNWPQALQWAQSLNFAGHDDWRLPNAKELQSIVDYTRSPDATDSPAIDPVFKVTAIANEAGRRDYPCYWTSTTHDNPRSAGAAVYLAFGRALGFMTNPRTQQLELLDVHGAGAQRCDFKTGSPSDLPRGRGPQGDVMRIFNFARCVRGGNATLATSGPPLESHADRSSNPADAFIHRLDRDGDGKVSRSEFDGPAQHFGDFDRNRDGYISSDEAPTGPPPQRSQSHRP